MEMNIQNLLLLAVIGATAGFLSGLMGLGGAVIIIPALVFFLGYTQQQAQGTTLGLMVLPIGFLAAWSYYQAGNIDIKAVAIMAVTFFIAGYFGGKMATTIDTSLMRKIFSVALILIAIKMFFQK
ncbi:MAG: sulfite exporter TauE/SafE family protein [Chitinophagales bacterium]|nr:sulfite exporter TauE/SafE family protein [Chitinophagales bacterium]